MKQEKAGTGQADRRLSLDRGDHGPGAIGDHFRQRMGSQPSNRNATASAEIDEERVWNADGDLDFSGAKIDVHARHVLAIDLDGERQPMPVDLRVPGGRIERYWSGTGLRQGAVGCRQRCGHHGINLFPRRWYWPGWRGLAGPRVLATWAASGLRHSAKRSPALRGVQLALALGLQEALISDRSSLCAFTRACRTPSAASSRRSHATLSLTDPGCGDRRH